MGAVFVVVSVVAIDAAAAAATDAATAANDDDDDDDDDDDVFLIEIEVDRKGGVFVFVAAANVTTIDGDN